MCVFSSSDFLSHTHTNCVHLQTGRTTEQVARTEIVCKTRTWRLARHRSTSIRQLRVKGAHHTNRAHSTAQHTQHSTAYTAQHSKVQTSCEIRVSAQSFRTQRFTLIVPDCAPPLRVQVVSVLLDAIRDHDNVSGGRLCN